MLKLNGSKAVDTSLVSIVHSGYVLCNENIYTDKECKRIVNNIENISHNIFILLVNK